MYTPGNQTTAQKLTTAKDKYGNARCIWLIEFPHTNPLVLIDSDENQKLVLAKLKYRRLCPLQITVSQYNKLIKYYEYKENNDEQYINAQT
jgi:hypothetical protein